MLLSNSEVEDTHRIALIAAASLPDDNLNAHYTNDEFIGSIKYQSVFSVIEQYDRT